MPMIAIPCKGAREPACWILKIDLQHAVAVQMALS